MGNDSNYLESKLKLEFHCTRHSECQFLSPDLTRH